MPKANSCRQGLRDSLPFSGHAARIFYPVSNYGRLLVKEITSVLR
jgi:hypothetical protein